MIQITQSQLHEPMAGYPAVYFILTRGGEPDIPPRVIVTWSYDDGHYEFDEIYGTAIHAYVKLGIFSVNADIDEMVTL